jgi:hypothetical protein
MIEIKCLYCTFRLVSKLDTAELIANVKDLAENKISKVSDIEFNFFDEYSDNNSIVFKPYEFYGDLYAPTECKVYSFDIKKIEIENFYVISPVSGEKLIHIYEIIDHYKNICPNCKKKNSLEETEIWVNPSSDEKPEKIQGIITKFNKKYFILKEKQKSTENKNNNDDLDQLLMGIKD